MICSQGAREQFEELLNSFINEKQAYFHGTSTALGLNIGDKLLPAIDTGILREVGRIDYRDVVFCTNSIEWAKKWSYAAVKRFGGAPVVFLIEPDYDSLAHRMNAEFTAKYAIIKGIMVN